MMGNTYATGKPYPPPSEWVPRVFRRDNGYFYVIALAEDDDLAEHARLNPGTLRIEDAFGKQLWPESPRIASAIDAATAGETTKIGSTVGESAGPKDDAHERGA